jgi:hypothetical protein
MTKSRSTVIKLSELGNRWDAPYHCLLKDFQKEVTALLNKGLHNHDLIRIYFTIPFDKEISEICFKSKAPKDLKKHPDEAIALAIVATIAGGTKELYKQAEELEKRAVELKNQAYELERLGIFDQSSESQSKG